MIESNAQRLISELLGDPRGFVEEGRPYALLQEYFAGAPLESLRELLRNGDPWVQRAAGFVASELGSAARGVAHDVIPLLSSSDLHAQNYAMEVLSVVSEGDALDLFAHVVRKLGSCEPGIRCQAMELVAGAAHTKLDAALRVFRAAAIRDDKHERGLVAITRESPNLSEIASMLQGNDRLLRQYGAIAMRRNALSFAQLGIQVGAISDLEILQFVQ